MEELKKGILVRNGVCIGALGDRNFSTAPLGTVLSFAGQTAPHGYLLCDGASYKVADYPHLYAVIGNTYGGDNTNFNVPNLVDKFIQGSNTSGTEKEAGLPNITGKATGNAAESTKPTPTGSFYMGPNEAVASFPGNTTAEALLFDASRSNAIYGNSDTVQPPALTMVYIIKAFHTNEGVDSNNEVSDPIVNYVEGEIDALVSDEVSDSTVWSSKKTSDEISKQSLPIAFDSGIINNSTVQVYKLANVGYAASGGTDAYNLNLLLSSRGAEEIELIGGKNDGGWVIEAIRNNKSFNKITNIYQDGLDIYVRLDLRCNYFRVYHKSGVLSGNFAVSLVDTVPESATELTINSASIDDTKSSTTSTYSSAKIDEQDGIKKVFYATSTSYPAIFTVLSKSTTGVFWFKHTRIDHYGLKSVEGYYDIKNSNIIILNQVGADLECPLSCSVYADEDAKEYGVKIAAAWQYEEGHVAITEAKPVTAIPYKITN